MLTVATKIDLPIKLEMPILSNIRYYNDKDTNSKAYFNMPAIQVYYM